MSEIEDWKRRINKIYKSLPESVIRDNKIEDYGILFKIFSEYVDKYLSTSEINSLKFHISCLFFRRLKHQIYKNRDLVEAYGDIAFRLIEEYKNNNTKWT